MIKFKKMLPNTLTILRLLLAALSTYYAYNMDIQSLTISLIIFCIASATDYLDGYFARRWKTVSSFGKLMDPIADKVLILGVLSAFSIHGVVPILLVVVIAFREIFLTVLRLIISKKIVLASRYSGKVKTFSQVIVLIAIYILLIYKKPLINYIDHSMISSIILVLVSWVTIISVYSAFDFLYHNRRVMQKALNGTLS